MPTEVLITFYCRTGATEKLALAAAVGAVQARATIRLRRLPDASNQPGGEDHERMCKEYVPPTEADVLRADAIVFAAPADFTPASPEWTDYLTLLSRCGSEGKLKGKIATVLAESDAVRDALSTKVVSIGFTTVPPQPQDPTGQGRRTAEIAKPRK
jgi:NAD(P)H dehydrogenase (quinone)